MEMMETQDSVLLEVLRMNMVVIHLLDIVGVKLLERKEKGIAFDLGRHPVLIRRLHRNQWLVMMKMIMDVLDLRVINGVKPLENARDSGKNHVMTNHSLS